jgi:hypothetical protein
VLVHIGEIAGMEGVLIIHGILRWGMIFSDLPSPAEAGFAKAGNR